MRKLKNGHSDDFDAFVSNIFLKFHFIAVRCHFSGAAVLGMLHRLLWQVVLVRCGHKLFYFLFLKHRYLLRIYVMESVEVLLKLYTKEIILIAFTVLIILFYFYFFEVIFLA